MFRFFALALLLILTSASITVAAQPASGSDAIVTQARARFKEGIEAAKRGDFPAAIAAFQQAHTLQPNDPETLRNLGAAYFHGGRRVEAARTLSKLLAEYGAELKNRASAEELLAEAETSVGRLTITVDVDGAEVSVDGEKVGLSPLRGKWYVEAGDAHVVAAQHRDRRDEKSGVVVAAGAVQTVSLRLAQSASQVGSGLPGTGNDPMHNGGTRDEPPDNTARTIVLVSGAALTVVSAGAAVLFMVSANNSDSEAQDLLAKAKGEFGSNEPCAGAGRGSSTCRELGTTLDDRNTANRNEGIAWALTGVVGVATVATYFLWQPERSSDPARASATWTIAPTLGARGAGAAFQASF